MRDTEILKSYLYSTKNMLVPRIVQNRIIRLLVPKRCYYG